MKPILSANKAWAAGLSSYAVGAILQAVGVDLPDVETAVTGLVTALIVYVLPNMGR